LKTLSVRKGLKKQNNPRIKKPKLNPHPQPKTRYPAGFRIKLFLCYYSTMTHTFEATIQPTPGQDGAYIAVPFDVRARYGKGRLKVHATFDGAPYNGSVVNMGVKNPDGSICYIISIRKDIRAAIGKQPGDTIQVTLKEQ